MYKMSIEKLLLFVTPMGEFPARSVYVVFNVKTVLLTSISVGVVYVPVHVILFEVVICDKLP